MEAIVSFRADLLAEHTANMGPEEDTSAEQQYAKSPSSYSLDSVTSSAIAMKFRVID